MADWWHQTVSWGNKPRYEPAPPVDENPWYSPQPPLPMDEHRDEHDGTYVYLLETHGAYKIGMSKNVVDRVKDLNCGSSERVELLAMRRGSQKLEHRLHKRLNTYRLNGEWFRKCDEVYTAFYGEPEYDTPAAA
jgi:hypothetical protein